MTKNIDEHSIHNSIIIDDVSMDSYFMRHRQVLTEDWNGGFNSEAIENFKKIVERL